MAPRTQARKKRKLSDDEYASDASSSSFEPTKPKRAQPQGKKQLVKRKKRASNDTDDEALDDGALESSITLPLHPQSLHTISSAEAMRNALTEWYSRVHEDRGMPWRKPYNPDFGPEERAQRAYEVWISEIMLQQTQVTTVIPYYNKWMASFPTIKDLAEANIETVNALWKGLGYYSRAARLLAGAKKAVEELGGRLPDNSKDMQAKIPGIGRYSAGAICSIAYNEQAPVLDGNVNRLMSRLLALHAPPKAKLTLDILWAGADAMVKGAKLPGDINQALIELGSTVCKPRDPACGECPLKPWCRAWQGSQSKAADADIPDIEEMCSLCEPVPLEDESGAKGVPVTAYPMKVERKKQREELDVVNVVEWRSDDDRLFLLLKRPDTGLLAGLHEFPTSPNVSTSISPSEVKAIPKTILSGLLKGRPLQDSKSTTTMDGLRIVKVQRAGDVLHVFSHIRKTYRVQWVLLEGGGSVPPELSPVAPPVSSQKGATKSGKVKSKPKKKKKKSSTDDEGSSDDVVESAPLIARWVPLEEVEHANIGTGVMKQWSLVRSLWDNHS
ncbi:DNA glycosylase [Dentipellis sp. KUC8613]|nr:DNA glycosylase [Dentipellis sp. KUC8613]